MKKIEIGLIFLITITVLFSGCFQKTEPKAKIEPGKTLGPGETVEAFWIAIREKRYDEIMGYISSSHNPDPDVFSSKEVLIESLKDVDDTDFTERRIVGVEYLDKQKTIARVNYTVVENREWAVKTAIEPRYYVDLQKENGVWKIVGTGSN